MKKLIYIMSMLICFQLSAQDPMIQKEERDLRAEAKTITDKYDAEIELDSKQTMLFHRKVEEFLIREEKIRAEYKEGKERLDLIYRLRQAETSEMKNILTQPQYDLYRQIKPKIQPLGKVDKERK